MSIFGHETSNTATDRRQTGGDAARNVQGTKNVLTEAGAVSVGDKGTFNTGLQLQDIKGNITINDTAPISELVGKTTTAFQEALGQQGDIVRDALVKVSDLSMSKQTEGDSGRQKFTLYVALGLFALVAAIFYFRR